MLISRKESAQVLVHMYNWLQCHCWSKQGITQGLLRLRIGAADLTAVIRAVFLTLFLKGMCSVCMCIWLSWHTQRMQPADGRPSRSHTGPALLRATALNYSLLVQHKQLVKCARVEDGWKSLQTLHIWEIQQHAVASIQLILHLLIL